MTAVLVGHFEPGSPDWHAARAHGIGGSEIAAVLGLSPFESRFSLYHRKAGTIGPVEESPEMEWGKRLEPAIVGKFFDEHPEYADEGYGTFRHSDRPWQVANPDRLLASQPLRDSVDALLETKFSLFGDGWGEAGTDEVPPHVRCQVLWYLDTLGLPVAHVAVLIGGHDYREYRIEANRVEQGQLRAAAETFLDDLAHGRRPDIDAHGATWQAIREMHPDIDPESVEIDGGTAARFIDAKAAYDHASADWQQARSAVADAMGAAQRATAFGGQTIATRQARDGGTPYLVAARGLTALQETPL